MRAFRQPPASRTTSATSLRDVRELLAPKDVPLANQLRSRSLPNMRLIRAFHLTNTFVSSDVNVHSHFTSTARKLLLTATPGGNWRFFTESATNIFDDTLSSSPITSVFAFDSSMQHFVLKIILHTLFGVPTTDLDDRGIALVAQGVNTLWKLSKTQEELPLDLLPSMNEYLRAWVPAIENPLDFVIPTFETLWRVVAITVAMIHNDRRAIQVFRDLLDNPTKGQFDNFPAGTPSVGAVVAEVMRLHPPTKSISRASTTSFSTFGECLRTIFPLLRTSTVHVASIRAIQRDPEIWGPDAEDFSPMRHHPDTLTSEQSRALLGFGFGKLQCVASSWAPMAVGLIAASVVDKIGSGLEIIEGEGIGGREGWDGWSILFKSV
ncbi:cytochrome P450 [Irpex rosettiformis]|uniref:Cytochrome P450 n=1 Tax=Irpex rosettiformis TaxID=378272 RepID=A0ACB8TVD6_9APHY|nr:cytochrome P450 [Irpex rosettiformis]